LQVGTGSVFTYSDPSVTFVFLFLFSAATIAICFLFTAFFTKGLRVFAAWPLPLPQWAQTVYRFAAASGDFQIFLGVFPH